MEKKPQKKRPKLTRKEKGFIKDFIETGNGTQSALKHYDTTSENVAAVIASENLSKPKIQQAIAERLPDDLLEEKHLQLLNACHFETIAFTPNDTDEDIATVIEKLPGYTLIHIKEVTDSNGAVTSKYAYVKAPDNVAQDKALDKAYKIKGLYAETEKPPEKQTNNYNFFFNPEVQTQVRELEDKIKAVLIKPNANNQEDQAILGTIKEG